MEELPSSPSNSEQGEEELEKKHRPAPLKDASLATRMGMNDETDLRSNESRVGLFRNNNGNR